MVRFCPFLTPFFLVGPFSSNHRSNHRLPKETPFDLALSGERHSVGSRTKVLTQHLCEGKGNKGLPFYDVSGEEAALLSFTASSTEEQRAVKPLSPAISPPGLFRLLPMGRCLRAASRLIPM